MEKGGKRLELKGKRRSGGGHLSCTGGEEKLWTEEEG